MRKVRVIYIALAGLALAEAALAMWVIETMRMLALGLLLLCAVASMF